MKRKKQTNNEKLMHKTAQEWANLHLQIERMEQGKLKDMKAKADELKAELRDRVNVCTPHGEKCTIPVQQGQVVVGARAVKWSFLLSIFDFRSRFHNELGDFAIAKFFKPDITRLRAFFKGRPEENDPTLFEKELGTRAVQLKLTD